MQEHVPDSTFLQRLRQRSREQLVRSNHDNLCICGGSRSHLRHAFRDSWRAHTAIMRIATYKGPSEQAVEAEKTIDSLKGGICEVSYGYCSSYERPRLEISCLAADSNAVMGRCSCASRDVTISIVSIPSFRVGVCLNRAYMTVRR